jgi:hypothetical protein
VRPVAGSTYFFRGSTFSQSPYYYRYASPYYYRGGFLSPYVHGRAPAYGDLAVTPRFNPSYCYDRTGRFDTRRYDASRLDRYPFDDRRLDSHNRLDRERIDRFHRPTPATPHLRVPPAGINDRYHFRGSGTFRGGGGSIGGSIGGHRASGGSVGRR